MKRDFPKVLRNRTERKRYYKAGLEIISKILQKEPTIRLYNGLDSKFPKFGFGGVEGMRREKKRCFDEFLIKAILFQEGKITLKELLEHGTSDNMYFYIYKEYPTSNEVTPPITFGFDELGNIKSPFDESQSEIIQTDSPRDPYIDSAQFFGFTEEEFQQWLDGDDYDPNESHE
jgi:hypothetical protein